MDHDEEKGEMNPRDPDRSRENPDLAGDALPAGAELQARLASARAATDRRQREEQERFEEELNLLPPFERVARVCKLMKHTRIPGPFGPAMPLSEVFIAQVQDDVVGHVQDIVPLHESESERIYYVRSMLLKLAVMADYEGLISNVQVRVQLVLDHFLEAQGRNTLGGAEGSVFLPVNARHLTRAAVILSRFEPKTKDDCNYSGGLLRNITTSV